MVNLTQLRLFTNQFNGDIPEDLYSATGLQVLRLDENYLGGTISSAIGNLVALEDLRLNDQLDPGFSGSIPVEIGKLNKLSKWQWLCLCPDEAEELTKLDSHFHSIRGSTPEQQ